MMRLAATIFLLAFFAGASAQQVRLHVVVITADKHVVTPAMVCITNVSTSSTYMPPGVLTPPPTYPDTFFSGVAFTKARNFAGPVRKMMGPGAVNGQRTYVYGHSPTLPYWTEPITFQTTGDFELDLPAGIYRISIEHGNEYIPVVSTITLPPQKKSMKMKFILKRWINLPARGWYSGDVHTHHPLNTSAFRDYSLQLAEAEDLHLMNVLQMGDRSDVYFQPQGYGSDFHISRNDITIATGQEEPRSIYGHIIGLNIDTLARDTSVYDHYDVVFDRLHKKREALVGFAHFAYAGEGVTPGLAMYAPTGAIDFLEMMQNTRINTSDYYDYLNLGFRFAAAYGSDFPWGSIPGDGRVFVYTGHPFSADKWFAGLKAGHTFVSNGPALFLEADGMIPGSQIIKKMEQRSLIRVKGLSDKSIGIIDTIRLIGSDGVLFEKANPLHADSIGFDFAHVVKKSQWVAAMVHCSNGAVAHTSPVYYVVDGQSTYNRDLGPAIIEKLVGILNKVRTDEVSKSHPDGGILSRVDTAISWYKALLKH